MGRSGKNYEKWENQLNRCLKTLKTMKRWWYQMVFDAVCPLFFWHFSATSPLGRPHGDGGIAPLLWALPPLLRQRNHGGVEQTQRHALLPEMCHKPWLGIKIKPVKPIKPLYPNIYPQYLSPWYWWTNPINQLGAIKIRCFFLNVSVAL